MVGEAILLGNLRGSLAGITASRNASKAFLRQRVTPVQPNTIAQLNAKSAFGANASIYRTISPADRTKWNQFAKTTYVPRKKSNKGQFTGQMSFMAIMASFANSSRLKRTYSFVVLPAQPTFRIADLPFVGSTNTPPPRPSQPALGGQSGTKINLSIPIANLDSAGGFDFRLQLGNRSGSSMPFFRNISDIPVGFAIYISSTNLEKGLAYKNLEKICIGYLEPPAFSNPAELQNITDIDIDSISGINTGDFQSFPVGLDWVIISVYLVTENNQLNLIGRKETQVAIVP